MEPTVILIAVAQSFIFFVFIFVCFTVVANIINAINGAVLQYTSITLVINGLCNDVNAGMLSVITAILLRTEDSGLCKDMARIISNGSMPVNRSK